MGRRGSGLFNPLILHSWTSGWILRVTNSFLAVIWHSGTLFILIYSIIIILIKTGKFGRFNRIYFSTYNFFDNPGLTCMLINGFFEIILSIYLFISWKYYEPKYQKLDFAILSFTIIAHPYVEPKIILIISRYMHPWVYVWLYDWIGNYIFMRMCDTAQTICNCLFI